MVPAGITDLLCDRLRSDALATGPVTVVRVTQPLVTSSSISSLKASVASPRSRKPSAPIPMTNRAIPIAFGQRCTWKPLDVFDKRPDDEMLVELSAPIINPSIPSEAGLFVRVTLAGENPSWYWIALVPKDDQWAARFIYMLGR
jgi:hypothetical protein